MGEKLDNAIKYWRQAESFISYKLCGDALALISAWGQNICEKFSPDTYKTFENDLETEYQNCLLFDTWRAIRNLLQGMKLIFDFERAGLFMRMTLFEKRRHDDIARRLSDASVDIEISVEAVSLHKISAIAWRQCVLDFIAAILIINVLAVGRFVLDGECQRANISCHRTSMSTFGRPKSVYFAIFFISCMQTLIR